MQTLFASGQVLRRMRKEKTDSRIVNYSQRTMLNRTYPNDWREISRHVRFELAEGECEACGVRHRSIHPLTNSIVYLSTAHLDRNTANNAPSNLMSLCQYCHLSYDRRDNIHIRRRRAILRTNPIPLFPSEELALYP